MLLAGQARLLKGLWPQPPTPTPVSLQALARPSGLLGWAGSSPLWRALGRWPCRALNDSRRGGTGQTEQLDGCRDTAVSALLPWCCAEHVTSPTQGPLLPFSVPGAEGPGVQPSALSITCGVCPASTGLASACPCLAPAPGPVLGPEQVQLETVGDDSLPSRPPASATVHNTVWSYLVLLRGWFVCFNLFI